jgi:monovalent cation:H+ antiporter, CPA1 family
MLTLETTLAIFVMLGLSSIAVAWAKRVGLPHTVFLVLIGIGLGFLSHISGFAFFQEFTLTPELVFYLLLPTLIFESAYNINIRRMVEEKSSILLLSTVSLLISALTIATALYYLLPFFHINAPFLVTLLFGALISATDPVAVLALFKEFGAPRRLSLIFEGESLFNDATAVALFLIILDIIINGFYGSTTIIEGFFTFLSMMIGGVLFGLVMGGGFSKAIGYFRESETASITLTIVLAHLTFILAELISHTMTHAELPFLISPIIATTVASLVMGNYGRAKLHPHADEFVHKLWEQLAFLSNSLIFILIGVLVIAIPIESIQFITVILATILIVAIARALSIYPIVSLFNIKAANPIPRRWQHLLSWGSLRGALAVSMVLLIPADITVPGWEAPISVQAFLLSLTIGCVFATLFIKATTMSGFMAKLKLNNLSPVEASGYLDAKALVGGIVQEKISRYRERNYLDEATSRSILARATHDIKAAVTDLHSHHEQHINARILRIFAIGIERHHLVELYSNHEVTENVFRKLRGKLQIQLEEIEQGNLAPNVSTHRDSKDVFERIAATVGRVIHPHTEESEAIERYLYYRAQAILARKVIKELCGEHKDSLTATFTTTEMDSVLELYETFKKQSTAKMDAVATAHPLTINTVTAQLAARTVAKISMKTLTTLRDRQFISPKLYITLMDEIEAHAQHSS